MVMCLGGVVNLFAGNVTNVGEIARFVANGNLYEDDNDFRVLLS